MKKITFILLLFGLIICFLTCKRIKLNPENTYIGTWSIAAIYIGNNSINNKDLAETIQPCLIGSTLEFTEDLKFDLQTDCDYMRAAGNYTFDDVSIAATDTLSASHITQIFTFKNGYLSKIVDAAGFKFDVQFKKIGN